MNYKVELTTQGWELILNALDALPHGKVRGLIDELHRQLQPQLDKTRAETLQPQT